MSPELNLQVVPDEPAIVVPQPVAPAEPEPTTTTRLERHILPQTGIRFEGEIGTHH